jgi:hypothetical protein
MNKSRNFVVCLVVLGILALIRSEEIILRKSFNLGTFGIQDTRSSDRFHVKSGSSSSLNSDLNMPKWRHRYQRQLDEGILNSNSNIPEWLQRYQRQLDELEVIIIKTPEGEFAAVTEFETGQTRRPIFEKPVIYRHSEE